MIALLLPALVAAAGVKPPTVVTVAEPETVTLAAGARAEARVVVTIKKGFHIQANPASEPFLVPARLELEGHERVRVGSPEYPPGKPYRLQGASSDLSVYGGTFVIRVPLEATAPPAQGAASEAAVVLEGSLHFQACNDKVCLRPSSVPLRVPVSLKGAPEGADTPR